MRAIPASADTLIASTPEVVGLEAYGGVVAWAQRKGARWKIVRAMDGQPELLQIPGFPSPPRFDLGPDKRRKVVAVYSRCRKQDCDVFQYSFRSRSERRVSGLSRRRFSERVPAVWGGRYALYRSRLPRNPRTRRSATGFVVTPPWLTVAPYEPLAIDVMARRLVFHRPSRTVGGRGFEDSIGFASLDEGGVNCTYTLAQTDTGSPSAGPFFVYSPTIDAGAAYWLESDGGVARTALPGPTSCAPQPTEQSQSLWLNFGLSLDAGIAVDRGRIYYAGRSLTDPTQTGVFQFDQPVWTRRG